MGIDGEDARFRHFVSFVSKRIVVTIFTARKRVLSRKIDAWIHRIQSSVFLWAALLERRRLVVEFFWEQVVDVYVSVLERRLRVSFILLVRGLSLHLRSIVHWPVLVVFRELTDMVSRVVTHSSLLMILPLKLLPLAIVLLPDLLDLLLQLSI